MKSAHKTLTKAERVSVKQYKADKAILTEKALQISVSGLKSAIAYELESQSLPYIVFEAYLGALEKKLSKKEFREFLENL